MRVQNQLPQNYQYALRTRQATEPGFKQADEFQASQSQDANPTYGPSNLQSSEGSRQALQFVGIGVMFGGILASSQLPGPWVGVGIIGSMCGGLAIMSLANR